MKIVQINTYDITGGAARAAYRLHRGLLQIGQDCRMLVRYKASTDDSIVGLIPENPAAKVDEEFFLSVAIQEHYINLHRTDISNTLFSFPYPGYDLSALPMVQEADIINLHWVANYQSPLTLHKLFALGKPVVWTLHDQWAFTGGCHYTAGCEEYRHGCATCPQLADDPFNLPGAILKDKLRLFENANLTIVTPSRWLAACAKESKLFKDLRVEVIPNALETDVFRALPKAEAKKSIGLTPDIVTLLFGGEDSNERRKGFRELKAAIKYCLKDARFENLVKSDKIRMICFGRPYDDLNTVGMPVVPLDYLDSDEKISAAYCAADIFVLPSLEDNLPNTMLEAMSCGTPVVAFDVGGMPDVIVNGVTGQLVPLCDTRQMGKAILSLIFNSEKRGVMGKKCREKIEEQYKLEIQAQRYLDLYQELFEPYASTAEGISEDHTSRVWEVPVSLKAEPLSVTLESGVGSHFKDSYDQVLLKALKELSCYVQKQWQASEDDRAARLKVIEQLGEKLEASEADRAARLKVIEQLGEKLEAGELDRSARLAVIEQLGEKLEASESDSAARLKVIEQLGEKLEASESDSAARLKVIEQLGEKLEASESDSAARLKVIEQLGEKLEASESDSAARLKVIEQLGEKLEASESDSAARLKVIEQLGEKLEASESDSAARLKVIEQLGEKLEASESDSAARLKVIEQLGEKLEASESDSAARLKVIEQLGEKLEASESDSAARLKVIEQLGEKLEASEADRAERLKVIEQLGKELEASESDRATQREMIERQDTEITTIQRQLNSLRQRFLIRALHRLRLV